MTHTVWIPALHRDLTQGVETVQVDGASLTEVIDTLNARYPGLRDRLCDENGLRPGIALALNGVIRGRGLRTKLESPSEIHFVPAMSGG